MNNSKINIMHAVLSLEVGGLERIVTESALAIDKKIFNVEVCCFDRFGEFAEKLKSNNINVTLLKRNEHHYDYVYPLKFRALLIKKNIHILHMHSGTFFLGTQSGILARTPVMIYTDHGRPLVESKIDVLMDRFSGFFVDQIIAVSRELENYLVEKIRLSEKKIHTIINGINTDQFIYRSKPLELMDEFGITPQDKVIGTVGRLAEVKDQVSLIEAFEIVHRTIPESVLVLVGDGPMKVILENKISELKLGGSVIITGNRSDTHLLLNMFDIFVLSSLSEGTSVALLEAMSSGVAAIATKVGGNTSLINENIHGVLVSPRQIDELAGNMLSLLQDKERSKEYSKNAAVKVREHFSIAKMVKEYEKVYLRLFHEKSKTPIHM